MFRNVILFCFCLPFKFCGQFLLITHLGWSCFNFEAPCFLILYTPSPHILLYLVPTQRGIAPLATIPLTWDEVGERCQFSTALEFDALILDPKMGRRHLEGPDAGQIILAFIVVGFQVCPSFFKITLPHCKETGEIIQSFFLIITCLASVFH